MEEILKTLNRMEESHKERISRLEDKLCGLIEINKHLIHENTRSKSNNTPVTKIDENSIYIENHGEGIKIYGKTYTHRSLFKENEGAWNKGLQAWVFPTQSKEKLISVMNENNIEFNEK
jgi:hypothetical protein